MKIFKEKGKHKNDFMDIKYLKLYNTKTVSKCLFSAWADTGRLYKIQCQQNLN